MRKAIVIAIWEWAPGVVGGALPLMVFVLAGAFRHLEGEATPHQLAFLSHLCVMAIVTSSVSVITSFGRILTGKIPNFLRDGKGPLLLVMLLLITLAYSLVLYALVEAKVANQPTSGLYWLSWWGLSASLVSSLYMEVAIARLHELAKMRRGRRTKGKGIQGSESSQSVVDADGECP